MLLILFYTHFQTANSFRAPSSWEHLTGEETQTVDLIMVKER